MPRRRPGALRAEQPRTKSPRAHIRGLSSGTCHAIHLVDLRCADPELHTGVTAVALKRYERFLTASGRRTLYPRTATCPAPGCALEDVRHARDVLEHVLWKLPKRAHTELSRRLGPLDELYLRRTLQNPFADLSRPWWHQRLPAD